MRSTPIFGPTRLIGSSRNGKLGEGSFLTILNEIPTTRRGSLHDANLGCYVVQLTHSKYGTSAMQEEMFRLELPSKRENKTCQLEQLSDAYSADSQCSLL